MRTILTSILALALIAPAVSAQTNKTVKIGQKAPDFSGIPATYMGQDSSISLSDVEEDVVVLVFLGNHCPYVKAIEDHLNDFVEEYEGKSVKLVGVAVNNSESDKLPAIKKWTAEYGSQYVYGYDESQQIGRDYGAARTPEFFVLDKDRTIQYMGNMYDNPLKVEPGDVNHVAEAVDSLLAGETVETPVTSAIGCGMLLQSLSKRPKRRPSALGNEVGAASIATGMTQRPPDAGTIPGVGRSTFTGPAAGRPIPLPPRSMMTMNRTFRILDPRLMMGLAVLAFAGCGDKVATDVEPTPDGVIRPRRRRRDRDNGRG